MSKEKFGQRGESVFNLEKRAWSQALGKFVGASVLTGALVLNSGCNRSGMEQTSLAQKQEEDKKPSGGILNVMKDVTQRVRDGGIIVDDKFFVDRPALDSKPTPDVSSRELDTKNDTPKIPPEIIKDRIPQLTPAEQFYFEKVLGGVGEKNRKLLKKAVNVLNFSFDKIRELEEKLYEYHPKEIHPHLKKWNFKDLSYSECLSIMIQESGCNMDGTNLFQVVNYKGMRRDVTNRLGKPVRDILRPISEYEKYNTIVGILYHKFLRKSFIEAAPSIYGHLDETEKKMLTLTMYNFGPGKTRNMWTYFKDKYDKQKKPFTFHHFMEELSGILANYVDNLKVPKGKKFKKAYEQMPPRTNGKTCRKKDERYFEINDYPEKPGISRWLFLKKRPKEMWGPRMLFKKVKIGSDSTSYWKLGIVIRYAYMISGRMNGGTFPESEYEKLKKMGILAE